MSAQTASKLRELRTAGRLIDGIVGAATRRASCATRVFVFLSALALLQAKKAALCACTLHGVEGAGQKI
jgi:hypothetical protein